MQLSSFTDYGIRVLIYLATLPKDQLTNINKVSEIYGISKNHLVKVVHRLGQLNYIETIQGKNGGIRLKCAPAMLNIGEIIRQLEPLQLLNCHPDFCHISPVCRLKKYLMEAKLAFIKELDKHTIADLLENNSDLYSLL